MKVSLASTCALLASVVSSSVTTECNNVTFQGLHEDGVETFLGIRFAQDTGGKNRFKPPKPYVYSAGTVVKATNPGPACPQESGATALPLYLGNITAISEDCLRLNVFRPNGTHSGSRLPVMVYIHGGSFFLGSKDDPVSHPSGLIKESVANGFPMMHISINYRLGVFGFAQSTALKTQGSENAGLRDQRMALEWIHDNIAAFGGDPEKITIHGQSSGGLAIGMQIMAYGANKPAPFQQAICQSQALEAGITGNYTRKAMARLAKATGCDAADLQSSATIECFRGLSLSKLLRAQIDTHLADQTANIGDEWLPVVDGDFLPAAPSKLIDSGRFYNVTTMIGWCEDDVTFFIEPADVQNATGVRQWFRSFLPAFSSTNLDTLLGLYPPSDFHSTFFPNGTIKQTASFYRAGRILREIVMVCQPILYGAALSKQDNPVYYYDQDQSILPPILASLGLYGYGNIHTSEFAYMFSNIASYNSNGFPFNPRAIDHSLARRESRSWNSFAALGHPSVSGKDTLQGWKGAEFDDETFGIYVIGGKSEGYSGKGGRNVTRSMIQDQGLEKRCAFLNRPDVVNQLGF